MHSFDLLNSFFRKKRGLAMRVCFIQVFVLVFTTCALVDGYSAHAITTDPIGPTTVSAIPSVGSSSVGDSIQVDIMIADVVGLAGYDLSIDFDSAILNATAVQQGEFLSSAGSALWMGETGGSAPGAVSNVVELLLGVPAGVSGAGRLFSIQFDVIGAGLTMIDLIPSPVSLLSDPNARSLDFMTSGVQFEGMGNNNIVPEPATLALVALGMGLVGGVGARRRKRIKSS